MKLDQILAKGKISAFFECPDYEHPQARIVHNEQELTRLIKRQPKLGFSLSRLKTLINLAFPITISYANGCDSIDCIMPNGVIVSLPINSNAMN